MNKEGFHRVIESAIKQYAKETGNIVTDISIDHVDISTSEKTEVLVRIGTTEHQLHHR